MTTCEEAKQMRSGINVQGKIRDKGEVRTVTTKFGETKVCDAFLEDESGSIKLTLWADDTEKVKNGDTVKLEGGYTTSFREVIQLNKGRKDGKLEVIQDSDKTEPEAEPCEDCGSKGICAESCRCDKCKRTRYFGLTDEEEEKLRRDEPGWYGGGSSGGFGSGGIANKDRGK